MSTRTKNKVSCLFANFVPGANWWTWIQICIWCVQCRANFDMVHSSIIIPDYLCHKTLKLLRSIYNMRSPNLILGRG